jgi:hypothetical protein
MNKKKGLGLFLPDILSRKKLFFTWIIFSEKRQNIPHFFLAFKKFQYKLKYIRWVELIAKSEK